MRTLLAIIKKNALLLMRDKAALLLLFMLPMCLVFLVSVMEDKTMDGKVDTPIVVINQDHDKIGNGIVKAFKKRDGYTTTVMNAPSFDKAKSLVSDGQYRALIYIPPQMTQHLKNSMRHPVVQHVALYLDPTMPNGQAKALNLALKYVMQTVQLKVSQSELSIEMMVPSHQVKYAWFHVDKHYAMIKGQSEKPNAVQQNVPAWALFGMFFIVIPLSAQMLQERSEGVIDRLKIAPTSQFKQLMGRTAAYTFLNLVQLTLMLLVGVYLLPLCGLPALNLMPHLPLVYLMGFFAALAATGFGILIGSLTNSYQQSISVGPFIIVIAAAISGIYMPINQMPHNLLFLSSVSPLYWAQSGLVSIFVRNAGLMQLLPNIAVLFGFFVLMIVLSLLPIRKIRS